MMNFGLALKAITHHCVSSDYLFCLVAGKRYSGDADNAVLGFLPLASLYCCLYLRPMILQIHAIGVVACGASVSIPRLLYDGNLAWAMIK